MCSVATVIIRRRRSPILVANRAAPLMAMLLISVAPEVKMISRASAPIRLQPARARFLDGRFRLAAHHVLDAMGVPVVVGEPRQHRLEHAGIAARGRLIIQIDRAIGARWRIRPAITGLGSGRPCEARMRTQPSGHALVCGHEGVNISRRHVPRQRDADRLARQVTEAHRRQHMAGLHLARAAGGAGADRDSSRSSAITCTPAAAPGNARQVVFGKRGPGTANHRAA